MTHGSAPVIVAVLILATALSLAQENVGRPKPPASMVPPVMFSSTLPTSTSKTTTSPPNTTTLTTTTTTHPTTHNTTTTTHPTTHNTTTTTHPTTHNTTTTTHPTTHNTTTTTHPTTHNTTANTTTPAPTPKPEPTPLINITVGNYTVTNGSKLCVMVQAAIQVHVNNSGTAGIYILPKTAKGNGTCESNNATLKITFNEGYISMTFLKNDTLNRVFVSAVAVNMTYAFKSGVLTPVMRKNESLQLFSMKTSHSYSCKSESVFMGDGTYLEFSQERVQAFNFTNNQFGTADECKADKPDYRVAIAVAVVLIILIIIVLVAYFISRKRRTDGYQTL